MWGPEGAPVGDSEWLKSYDLALEDKVACDTKACPREGAVFNKVNCCGNVGIFCRPCMVVRIRSALDALKAGREVRCGNCNKVSSPSNWLTKPQEI